MKYACCLLLLVCLFYLQQNKLNNQINYKEGFSVPTRYIDTDLQSYLQMGNMGGLTLTKKEDTRQRNNLNPLKDRHKNTIDAKFARLNTKECNDSGGYSGCAISSPSPPKIDFRYVNLPTNQINNSDIYTNLSICPKTYQKNMEILSNKISVGQYSGYTTNDYIDKTRYIDISKTGPLPVNPDFFMKNGGTY